MQLVHGQGSTETGNSGALKKGLNSQMQLRAYGREDGVDLK